MHKAVRMKSNKLKELVKAEANTLGGIIAGRAIDLVTHEMGHAGAILLTGNKIIGIKIDIISSNGYVQSSPPSNLEDIIITSSGPLAGISFGLASIYFGFRKRDLLLIGMGVGAVYTEISYALQKFENSDYYRLTDLIGVDITAAMAGATTMTSLYTAYKGNKAYKKGLEKRV